MDWLPVDGQTGVELPGEPEQGARPPDLSVFSASQGESRGVTLFQEYPIEKFVEWNDGYSTLEDEIPWLFGYYLNDVSHFDITIDGGVYGKVLQATSYSHTSVSGAYPRSSNTYLLHEANGEKVFGGISLKSFGQPFYYMDFGDVSCAVIGHDGSDKGQDENFYSIGGYSTMPGGNPDPDNPVPDNGEYKMMQWYYPYDLFTDPNLFQRLRVFGMSARDPVDPGPIEDFEPRDQHLGVDDNTGVYLDWYGPGHPDYEWAEFFYVWDRVLAPPLRVWPCKDVLGS